MAELSLQDAYLLEKVVDPNSKEYADMLNLLMLVHGDDRRTRDKLSGGGKFRFTVPFRGEPEDEMALRDLTPLRFPDKGSFINGAASMALVMAEMVDLVSQSSGKRKLTPSVCVSQALEVLEDTMGSAGALSAIMVYSKPDDMVYNCLNSAPETLIYDHTTSCMPIDELLNFAFVAGIQIVDGVFPYHVAALRGWDTVSGLGRWSYTHTSGHITVGPNDDPSRLVRYRRSDYLKFVEPSSWQGNAKKYGYELRRAQNGLVTYRAVYLGDVQVPDSRESLAFQLPVCSSDDMVLVTINKDLAAGVFASGSNNAQALASLNRDYAIEVRKELFTQCVDFLISQDKKSDIMGLAIRYITQHNYVDLVDGIRIVRCPSLSYADALCVAMVCALTSFQLRYRLTNESLPDISRHRSSAGMSVSAPFGTLGKLVWWMSTYVSDAVNRLYMRAVESARHMLFSSDYIPGVCFDVYATTTYSPELDWFEPRTLGIDIEKRELDMNADKDFVVEFLADTEKTSAPTADRTIHKQSDDAPLPVRPYKHRPAEDPRTTLQEFYDRAFPGNSTVDLPNIAELKHVKPVDIHTEFHGRLEINKDAANNERLHQDPPVRTAAMPTSKTRLTDAIIASAKRNFNPPDIQMQNDPWEYADYLVEKFVSFAFDPGFDQSLGESYRKDPITFNVADYLDWRASKDHAYRSALEAECPEELVELNLEKFDTTVKSRIKTKLSTSAQFELAQPQVLVASSKRDTAMFSHVFRRMFERLEAALRPEIRSAGRMSDAELTEWFTENMGRLLALNCFEIDSSKYDKSQNMLARMVEAKLMIRLGLDPNVYEIFQDSYVGRVSSKTLGLMFISAYQMKSGAPQTMLGNTVYNMVSAMESVGPENIKLMIAKGDDNLVWSTNNPDPSLVVGRMSSLFNLECKLITDSVWYFSSGYVVHAGGRLFYVPDPVKAVELLGEMGQDPRTLAQRFVSFSDKVKSFTVHEEVPAALQDVVRSRMQVHDLQVVMAVDAMATVASSYKTFSEVAAS